MPRKRNPKTQLHIILFAEYGYEGGYRIPGEDDQGGVGAVVCRSVGVFFSFLGVFSLSWGVV